MYLFLNTSAQTLALYKGDGAVEWHPLGEHRYTERLKDLLTAHGSTPADLKGIVVMQGKGSFSDTRAGAVAANMLLSQLDVPVLAIETADGDEPWKKALAALANKPIEPAYYAEPNITKPKK